MNSLFDKQKQLRKALKAVVRRGRKAIPSILDREGNLHLPGLGVNTLSKILAAHDPSRWPVLNGRVAAVLLKFGYELRGSPSQQYLVYVDAMDRFIADIAASCGIKPDALALDAFFYDYSTKLSPQNQKDGN